ncbi:hypothetical protein [Kribbella antiqua]|nr:hypothetical protein [Kribbella antiqua]
MQQFAVGVLPGSVVAGPEPDARRHPYVGQPETEGSQPGGAVPPWISLA